VLSGICLGFLTYKPQYGLLFPIVLIATGRWNTFAAAAVTALVLAGLSWFAFGIESWQAFFHWLPHFSQAFLVEGKATWWKLQSLYSLIRYLGGSEQLGWTCQWALTAGVAVVLALMWRSPVRYSLKAAALAVGTLLTTPYLFIYDIMVLAIAVAFLVRIGLKDGFQSYELPALAAALLLPVVFVLFGIPAGLAANLIVAALILRRAGSWWRREPAVTGAAMAAAQ
jgi:arabinofuranan 3-O-arabinosyltransferase